MVNIIESTLRDSQTTADLIDKFDQSRGTLVLRGIEAGPGITLEIVDADDNLHDTTQKKIVISSDTQTGPVVGEANTASNLGSLGEGVFFEKNGIDFRFKRLVAGDNVALSSDNNTITIEAASLGESNTASNLGTGSEIFAGKNGVDFEFRTIESGSGINVFQTADTLTIESTVLPGERNTTSNLGMGIGLAAAKSGSDLPFKSLVAGTGIEMNDTGDSVFISALPQTGSGVSVFTEMTDTPSSYTGESGKVLMVSPLEDGLVFLPLAGVATSGNYNHLTNTPTLSTVATTGSYNDLTDKPTIPTTPSLDDLTDVDLTGASSGHVLTYSGTGWVSAPAPTGGGSGGISSVMEDSNPRLGGNLDVNGNQITGNVIINGIQYPSVDGAAGQVLKTSGSGLLYWGNDQDTVSGSGEVNTASNIGVGTGLFKQKTSTDLEFKSIEAGSHVVITDGDTVSIAVDLDLGTIDGNLEIAKGGTGATNAAGARTNLGLGTIAEQNADSVAITGGTAILSTLNGLAYPTTDGTAGQVLSTDGAGTLAWSDVTSNAITNAANIVYVATNGDDDNGDGGLAAPYQTIGKAIQTAPANTVVVLNPGIYNEDVSPAVDGLTFIGFGSGSKSRTVINGKMSITGVANTLVENAILRNTTDVALQLFNGGSFTAMNSAIERSANTDAVRIDGTMSGDVDLNGTKITGVVTNANTGTSGKLIIRNTDSSEMTVQNLTSGAVTHVDDCGEIGWVRHDGGVLNLKSIGRIIANSGGNSVVSSASQASHKLSMVEVNLDQGDGTFGLINKTASCPYVLVDVIRDVANDTLSGTREKFGRYDVDVEATHIPTNYTAAENSIKGHLEGIDAVLAASGGLQSVSEDATPTLGGDLNVDGNKITGTEVEISAPLKITSGDAKAGLYVLRGETTSATPSEVFLDGASSRIMVPTDNTWMFTVKIVARRTDVDHESASFELSGCVDNNAGSTQMVGNPTKSILGRDNPAWDVEVIADDVADSLKIVVTGETAKTVRWVAFVNTVEVSG